MLLTGWFLLIIALFIEFSSTEEVKCYKTGYGGIRRNELNITSDTLTVVSDDGGCTKSIDVNIKLLADKSFSEPFGHRWNWHSSGPFFGGRLPIACNQTFERRTFVIGDPNQPYAQKYCRCCGNLCNDERMDDACNKLSLYDDNSSTCANADLYKASNINYDFVMRCTASEFCNQPGTVRVANLFHLAHPVMLGCYNSRSSRMPDCGSCWEQCSAHEPYHAYVIMICTCCGEKQCREWNFDRRSHSSYTLYMMPEENNCNAKPSISATTTAISTPQTTGKPSNDRDTRGGSAMCFSGSSCSGSEWNDKVVHYSRERSPPNGNCHKRITISYNSPADTVPVAWWTWGYDENNSSCDGSLEEIGEEFEFGKRLLYYQRTCSCCGDLCNDARLNDVCNEVPKIDKLCYDLTGYSLLRLTYKTAIQCTASCTSVRVVKNTDDLLRFDCIDSHAITEMPKCGACKMDNNAKPHSVCTCCGEECKTWLFNKADKYTLYMFNATHDVETERLETPSTPSPCQQTTTSPVYDNNTVYIFNFTDATDTASELESTTALPSTQLYEQVSPLPDVVTKRLESTTPHQLVLPILPVALGLICATILALFVAHTIMWRRTSKIAQLPDQVRPLLN